MSPLAWLVALVRQLVPAKFCQFRLYRELPLLPAAI